MWCVTHGHNGMGHGATYPLPTLARGRSTLCMEVSQWAMGAMSWHAIVTKEGLDTTWCYCNNMDVLERCLMPCTGAQCLVHGMDKPWAHNVMASCYTKKGLGHKHGYVTTMRKVSNALGCNALCTWMTSHKCNVIAHSCNQERLGHVTKS